MLLRETIEHWRDFGPRETFLAAVSRILTISAKPVLHRRARPSLHELHSGARTMALRAEEATRAALTALQAPSFETIAAEYEDVRERLREAYATSRLTYPTDRRLGDGSALLIYALIRGARPRLVLETGIANGHSTFVILSALERNGLGRLVSIDVDAATGSLVTGMDLGRWDRRLLGATNRARSFREIVSSLDPIDVFLHDSDHSYRWQRLEYATLRPQMASSSVMASDDVDASFAFLEFCRDLGRRPTLLVEERKVFGMVDSGAGAPQQGMAAG